jgi:HD-GYP domain-containing protein (c-di-GMP phosphodiesterase class II)
MVMAGALRAAIRAGWQWSGSVRVRMIGALGALCLFLAGATAFLLYELDLRQHDYQILNLAGQMRVLASTMDQQANELLSNGILNVSSLDRGFDAFDRSTTEHVARFDRIITSLAKRELPADLIGRDEPLRCTWDHASRTQLDRAVETWTKYRQGLETAGGVDSARPRTVAIAAYMATRGPTLMTEADQLATTFQDMMEGKLSRIRQMVAAMLGGALLTAGVLAALLSRGVLRPIDAVVEGFSRVAAGDLGYQVEPARLRELTRMTGAFNHLSRRLNGIVRLTERLGRGVDVGETLQFINDEFRRVLPVDALALLMAAPEGGRYLIEHVQAGSHGWGEIADPLLDEVLRRQVPRVIDAADASGGAFCEALRNDGMASALLLPLSAVRDGGAMLLVTSHQPGAYTAEHRQFLGAVATHLDSVLAKTVVMDGLVVAAIEGLAKLAESRDPETGDHLVRMSLYAALIAEELAEDPAHRDVITPAFVRAVHRFAPMHDIGKVGIADSILLKPGRLTEQERSEMCRHPLVGGEVLRLCEQRMNDLGRSIFAIGIDIAEGHHEKWDGSGYPRGLNGEAIPLAARIVAVADVFDALTSKRPYKEAWPVDRALEAMAADAGHHFDPAVLAAFERVLPRVMEVYDRLKHV